MMYSLRIAALAVAAFTVAGWVGALEQKDLVTTQTKPAPGLELTEQSYTTPKGPVAVYALKVDLSSASGLKAVPQLGKGKLYSGDSPEGTVKRLKAAGKDPVAVVNADFWDSKFRLYHPVGMMVADKMFYNLPGTRSVLFNTNKDSWKIDVLDAKVQVKLANGKVLDVDDVNPPTTGTSVALYTCDDTRAPIKGYTYRTIKLAEPEFLPNKPVKGTIVGDMKTAGVSAKRGELLLATSTPEGKAILEKLKDGEALTVDAKCPQVSGVIENAIGGGPRLIRDGEAKVEFKAESIGEKFCTDLHPRTAVGFDKEKKNMWLVVVDGRQRDYSVGINLMDLAELMKGYGCYDAMNLDGGGSSGMFVGDKYANKPSDASGARAVVNHIAILKEKGKAPAAK